GALGEIDPRAKHDSSVFQAELERGCARWAGGDFDTDYAETFSEFTDRVDGALDAVFQAMGSGESTLVVSSAGAISWTATRRSSVRWEKSIRGRSTIRASSKPSWNAAAPAGPAVTSTPTTQRRSQNSRTESTAPSTPCSKRWARVSQRSSSPAREPSPGQRPG